jgi:hypothetical protein
MKLTHEFNENRTRIFFIVDTQKLTFVCLIFIVEMDQSVFNFISFNLNLKCDGFWNRTVHQRLIEVV